MQLQFKENYLSISEFEPIELTDFTILTGVNGSGKSHLLEAIENRKVVVLGLENSNIVRFILETFCLENEGKCTTDKVNKEIKGGWEYYVKHIRGHTLSWKNRIKEEYDSLVQVCQKEGKSLWGIKNSQALELYRREIKIFFNNSNMKNNQAQAIYSLIKSLPYSIDQISENEFIELYKPFYFKNEFLPHQLGLVIWDYYAKSYKNSFHKHQNDKDGTNFSSLSEEDFIKKYGPKPWELINKILTKFNSLDYEINSPEGHDYFENFQLKLIHTKKQGLEINFNNLSSGERILMALVAAVYKASADNHFPDILLLDEIDGSLHPSMINNMLEVIKDIFLNNGIKIILVTHSPTTIALAPEESIFVMHKDGEKRFEKKSKQDALTILTEGIATLEEGIRFLDEVSQKPLSIISEGDNSKYIEKLLELNDIHDVSVITGVEDITNDMYLKALFEFFSRIPHKNKVIFVWDWDIDFKSKLSESENTHPFVFEKNEGNSISPNGIENLFDEKLFEGFTKKVNIEIPGKEPEKKEEFYQRHKKRFLEFILERNDANDFKRFQPLIEFIKSKM